MKFISAVLWIVVLALVFTQCNKDEKNVAPVIDNEALTTVRLELVQPDSTADAPIAQWEQLLDNNGNPQDPDFSKDTLWLKANKTYHSEIVMLDKSQDPPLDATLEIRDRSDYHLFFYQPLPTKLPLVIPNNYPTDINDLYPAPIPTPVPDHASLNLSVTITDHDSNTPSLPLGLASTFTTGAASTGWLRLVLRHQPGQKNGTYAPGETDLDVGFVVVIK